MTDDRAKTPRTILIAEHLWDVFAKMAVEMGGERDALINQALYTFARLNGFLVPSDLKRLAAPPPAGDSSRPRTAPSLPPTLMAVPDERPAPRSHGNPDRVAEIAQQLAGSNMPRSSAAAWDRGAAPKEQAESPSPATARSEPSPVQVDDSLLGEEGKSTSMDLPAITGAVVAGVRPAASMVAAHRGEASGPGSAEPSGRRMLVLLADGRELDRVVKDRFLIGRGKHCDLIINSGKVSREHAAITREGNVWFIEDLGSSNGTWFDKRRINRRQIQEGDEYFICSEKLSCTFR